MAPSDDFKFSPTGSWARPGLRSIVAISRKTHPDTCVVEQEGRQLRYEVSALNNQIKRLVNPRGDPRG